MEDKQLLHRVRSGNTDALQQIYEKYVDDVFTVLVSLLRDVHASEDCLQEVFVNFAANADRFSVRHDLKRYLISCAVNLARDHLKEKTTQLNCPLEELSPLAIQNDPAQELINEEDAIQLLKALAELPFEQRETFVLHVQGGLKFREIANVQNISIKTAQSRYRYAIEKLQTLLVKGNTHEIRK